MTKLFLVVLYKTDLSKADTLVSFEKLGLFKSDNNYFVVWDNSPLVQNSEEIENFKYKSKNCNYRHTPENISLAIIYNTIIKEYPNIAYFIIFDQDSLLFNEKYEEILNTAIRNNPDIYLFIPRILTSKGVLYSPGRFVFPGKSVKIKKIKNGVHYSRNINGIASGIIIKRDYFKKYNYCFNENLNLYGIDTDFFINYSKNQINYFLLDYEISHGFSFENSELSTHEKWLRYCQVIEALFIIYKKKGDRLIIFLLKLYYQIKKTLHILKYS